MLVGLRILHFKMAYIIGLVLLIGTAIAKLAILAFLYCGVFVKNSNINILVLCRICGNLSILDKFATKTWLAKVAVNNSCFVPYAWPVLDDYRFPVWVCRYVSKRFLEIFSKFALSASPFYFYNGESWIRHWHRPSQCNVNVQRYRKLPIGSRCLPCLCSCIEVSNSFTAQSQLNKIINVNCWLLYMDMSRNIEWLNCSA